MRVIYYPQNPENTGAIGWFIDDQTIRIVPGEVVDIPDRVWAKLEREESVANLMAEGSLQPA